ncbi:metal ABC transporter permease [Spongiibacter sp.]|uniref:metal ABC transporter permease n=1 Tax=Spongiibacter sp. TaxID=2024860 RepID=UPI00356861BE
MTDILINALLAGLLLAILCGPLGALVTWQRMAYYGDTLAHSALLGLALGLSWQIRLELAVLIACCSIAVLLFALQLWRDTALDSLLGILSHSSLALGLVCLSFMDGPGFDLSSFLFGDLLAVMQEDLWLLAAITTAVSLLLAGLWPQLVAMTAHAELAAVEGSNVQALRLLLMLMIAATVAVAMKIVGVLLITAMLIIPASAAGRLARSPEQCAALAVICGMLAVAFGLLAAWHLDSPGGPSVVLSAGLLFLLAQLGRGFRRA